MTLRACIIAAVSTVAQADEDKASLPQQIADCQAVCDAHGCPVELFRGLAKKRTSCWPTAARSSARTSSDSSSMHPSGSMSMAGKEAPT